MLTCAGPQASLHWQHASSVLLSHAALSAVAGGAATGGAWACCTASWQPCITRCAGEALRRSCQRCPSSTQTTAPGSARASAAASSTPSGPTGAHGLLAARRLQRPGSVCACGGAGRAGQGPARSGRQLRRYHLHGAPGCLAGSGPSGRCLCIPGCLQCRHVFLCLSPQSNPGACCAAGAAQPVQPHRGRGVGHSFCQSQQA